MFLSHIVRDEILFLNLHDKASRNALSLRAARELNLHLGKRNYSALVFSAEGRVFCSGGQLSDYASMATADDGRRVNDEIRSVLELLSNLDRPTVAAVGGDVFGGGVELLSAFDLVIASSHVMLGLWQRKVGLTFGWGGGARLEKRIGTAALRHLSMSTQSISAHEALRLGLVDQVVQESTLHSAAYSAAKALISLPREPLEALKSFNPQREVSDFNSLWWNESHRAILTARKK